jgi:hypothetical protein
MMGWDKTVFDRVVVLDHSSLVNLYIDRYPGSGEQRIKYEYCNVDITSSVPKGICRRIILFYIQRYFYECGRL